MSVDTSKHTKAYALMRTISGSCGNLHQVWGSLAKRLGDPRPSRDFALQLLDPLVRSLQLCRMAEVSLYLKGQSMNEWVDQLVEDLKVAAGSKIPSDKHTTKRMRNLISKCQRTIEGLGGYVSKLAPKKDYEQTGMDPGNVDPMQHLIRHYPNSLKAKKRTFRDVATVMDSLSSFYQIGGFQASAALNLQKFASRLRDAVSNVK